MMETEGGGGVCDQWDRLLYQLSVQPRRQITVSLLDVSEERRLLLPEAALPSTSSVNSERFATELKHHHLPTLASAGYVRWEQDPFCVQRGPHFEVPAAVMQALIASADPLPGSLTQGGIVETYETQ